MEQLWSMVWSDPCLAKKCRLAPTRLDLGSPPSDGGRVVAGSSLPEVSSVGTSPSFENEKIFTSHGPVLNLLGGVFLLVGNEKK